MAEVDGEGQATDARCSHLLTDDPFHTIVPTSRRLYVGGLDESVTEKELADRLRPFGTVANIDLRPGNQVFRGFSYITATMTKANVKKCISAYAHSTWRGMKLRIEEAKPDYQERLKREREAQVTNVKEIQAREQPRLDRKRKRSLIIELPRAACTAQKADVEQETNVAVKAVLEKTLAATGNNGKWVWWKKIKSGKIAPVVKITMMRKGKKRIVVVNPMKYRSNHKRFEDQPQVSNDGKRAGNARIIKEPSILDVYRKIGIESFSTDIPNHSASTSLPSKSVSNPPGHLDIPKEVTSKPDSSNRTESPGKITSSITGKPLATSREAQQKKNTRATATPYDFDDDEDSDDNFFRTTSKKSQGRRKRIPGTDRLWDDLEGDEEDDRNYANQIKSVGDEDVSRELQSEKSSALQLLKSMALWGAGAKAKPIEEPTVVKESVGEGAKEMEVAESNATRSIMWIEPARFDPNDDGSRIYLLEEDSNQVSDGKDDEMKDAKEEVGATSELHTIGDAQSEEETAEPVDVTPLPESVPSSPPKTASLFASIPPTKPAEETSVSYKVNANLRALVFGGSADLPAASFSLFGGSDNSAMDVDTDVPVQADAENMSGLTGDALRVRAGAVGEAIVGQRTHFSLLGALGIEAPAEEPGNDAARVTETKQKAITMTSADGEAAPTALFSKPKMFFFHLDDPELSKSDDLQRNWEETRRDLTAEYKRKHRSAARRSIRSRGGPVGRSGGAFEG
ncbi:nucleolar protein 8 [Dinochytrium kinnereticum]|nr:nucleolar protein 8 [Dinochytrium kinnereticum]